MFSRWHALLFSSSLFVVSALAAPNAVDLTTDQPHDQFDFLLGHYQCEDTFYQQDGTSSRTAATWSAHRILGDQAIQDNYANGRFHATSIRSINAKTKQWQVVYFREPGNVMGVWHSQQSPPGKISLTRTFEWQGQPATSWLTFENITPSSFQWHSTYELGDKRFVDWRSDCERAK